MRIVTAGRPRRPGLATVGALAICALTAAGCGTGTSGAPAASPAATGMHHPMASPSHAMARTATVGPDCAMVPATGMGSIHGMSMDPVVTAAGHDPLTSAFAADIRRAGLAGDLDSRHPITVFAPSNSALRTVPHREMSMMRDPMSLARIVKSQVVNGRVTPGELASGMTFRSLAGGQVKGAKMGRVYEVNRAGVLCGNIQTSNATIYVINKLLAG